MFTLELDLPAIKRSRFTVLQRLKKPDTGKTRPWSDEHP